MNTPQPQPYPHLRVFIPSHGRAATIRSHRTFTGAAGAGECLKWTVVVHSEADRAAYLAAQPALAAEPERVVVSGVRQDAYGLTRQREWICRNLAVPGEWFVFADDNIRALTALPAQRDREANLPTHEGDGATWRRLYATPCPPDRFLVIAEAMIRRAESVGAHLCGFATVDNPYFRGKHFRTVAFVCGKLMLWYNRPFAFDFDHTLTMEDHRHTAEHLLRDGAVLVNNWLYPIAGHYEPGGMGTYAERRVYRRADVQELLRRYPGLYRTKERRGFDPETDITLRLHSRPQLEAWRRVMLARAGTLILS